MPGESQAGGSSDARGGLGEVSRRRGTHTGRVDPGHRVRWVQPPGGGMDDGPSSSPLGYKPLVGAQMRYAVHDRDGRPVAMLGFSTAAWKLAPRDRFIGWTPQLREKNLPLVVDNPRFLILPWIKIPNLGSHILAIVRRRLPEDWTGRYNTTPVLIETFVQTPRYTGAVYRASAGSMSEPPRDADATTGTDTTTSRRRTSGRDRCGETGSKSSIAETTAITPRLNGYRQG